MPRPLLKAWDTNLVKRFEIEIMRVFRGPRGWIAAAGMLLAYALAGLEPFHWKPPRLLENGVETRRNLIRFTAPGIIHSRMAPTWLPDAIRSHEFQVRLRVRSYSTAQSGPARIFTVSANPSLRNLTIGQEGLDLVVRLRTPDSTLNGTPPLTIPRFFSDSGWRDLELRVEPGRLTLLLDDQPALRAVLPREPLRDWNRGFRVAFGNELTGNRPWLGEISQAHVTVNGTETDYLDPRELEVPPMFLAGIKRPSVYPPDGLLRDRGSRWDMAFNFICFIPVGFVMGMLRGERGSFALAVAICAIASLSVEVTQFFFDQRNPSVSDWGLNVAGAVVGAWLARRLIVRVCGQARRPAFLGIRSAERHFQP